jgi:hypothetical protein
VLAVGLGLQSQFKPGKSNDGPKRKLSLRTARSKWMKQQDKWSKEKAADASARGF